MVWPESVRFGDALKGHDNALGFLRLFFAVLVIVDHSFPLGGFGDDPMWIWSKGQESMGGIAVSGFFVISGYLVTKSAGSADCLQFFWRRALRIFPAYWVMLLLVAAVLAPALWLIRAGSLSGYWQPGHGGPYHYFYGNMFLSVGQFGVYDLLVATTPYGQKSQQSVFNGSIWTLIYEWRCYVLVGLLAAIGIIRRVPWALCLLALVLYFLMLLQLVAPDQMGKVAPWLADPYNARWTFLFVLGGVMAAFADRIVVDDAIGFAAGTLYVFALTQGGYLALASPAMVYLLLWLAVRLPPVLKRVGAVNDYSYGVYLYGFLVQQVLAHLGVHLLGWAPYTLVSIALAGGCAYLSWHGIEKWALDLKSRGPGLGWRHWRRTTQSWLSPSVEGAR